jgi:hypothetical protein
MNSKRLYFLHIPKTAGKSVGYEIGNELKKNNVSHYISTHYPNDSDLSKEIYFSGHFGTYPIEKFPDISVSCLVRNPIEARVSYFNFIYGRNDLDVPKYNDITGYINKLKYYLFEDEDFFVHNNYQSRYICNPTDEIVFADRSFWEKNEDAIYDSYNFSKGKGFNWFVKNDNTSIENATKMISSFDIVNTVESIDAHYNLLSKWFLDNHGVKLNLNYNNIVNASNTFFKGSLWTTKKLVDMLTDKEKEKILENNYIDYHVYSMVKDMEKNEKKV